MSLWVFLTIVQNLPLTPAFQNYDFPNNCEDYIHRIGRTGVSLGPDIDADGRVTDIVFLSVLA